MFGDFYERPMVARIKSIFGNPKPPERITQVQFDGAQQALVRTSSKPWHEIGQEDYWHYLNDLSYVDLQPDLFDYLFPAFLIRWWEGQLNRLGGPQSESDIYFAIDQGQVFEKMMDDLKRRQVLTWMADAYIDGVDAWSGELSVIYDSQGPNNLHGPLWSFHALGQSVAITRSLLESLSNVSTIGRAQWWLVLGSGLVWNENECPAIPAWTPHGGGGGVYVTESDASIFDHGYLAENLRAIGKFLTYERLCTHLGESAQVIPSSSHRDWAKTTWQECVTQTPRIERRIARLIQLLGLPDLGGVRNEPLD